MAIRCGPSGHGRSFALFFLALASIGLVRANPPVRRAADTTSSPSATIPSSTSSATASPTSSGTSDPALVTGSVTSTTSGTSASTDSATPVNNPGPYPTCSTSDVGPFPPFCLPVNGSDKYPGDNYYVTWDPSFYQNNETITVELIYVNTSTSKGLLAWTSDKTDKAYGHVIINMDKAWMQSNDRNNLTFVIHALGDGPSAQLDTQSGPTISLTNPPVMHYPPPPLNHMPNRLGMLIGLPVGLGFVVLMLCGLFIGMRRHRKIGLGSVMGRGKGYLERKSRRQRMGKKGGIRLAETEADIDGRGQYVDEPVRGVELQNRRAGHERDDSLGSLANSPLREGFGDPASPQGNTFRDEITRQRIGR